MSLKSEEECLKILEDAEKNKSYPEIVDVLEKLGQHYFLKDQFATACKVLNAAIALNDTYVQDESMKSFLYQSLMKIENTYVEKVLGKKTNFIKSEIEKIIYYRERFRKFSKDLHLKLKIDEDASLMMQEILKEITDFKVKLTKDLIEDCVATLGSPPCKHAFVRMGSMSRDEASLFWT